MQSRCTASGTRALFYPTIRSRPTQSPAFSTFLSTLPTPVIGNSVTNLMCFGACAAPLRAFTSAISSSAFGFGAFACDHDRGDGLDPDDLPQRGAIDIAEDIDIGAREKRPARWRDIWSAGHSTSGVSGVLSVDDLVAQTMAEYRAAAAR